MTTEQQFLTGLSALMKEHQVTMTVSNKPSTASLTFEVDDGSYGNIIVEEVEVNFDIDYTYIDDYLIKR